MPVYFYWGEDEYRLQKTVQALRARVLDPDWVSFNFHKISSEASDAVVQALNQVMTPPFGLGQRLVWLASTTLGQRCSEEVLAELSRTLPQIPDTSHLLFTSASKPDGRSKAVKLLQQHGEIQEFALIPGWKTEELLQAGQQAAREVGVQLSPEAMELLVGAVGNDTRLLYAELEKLRLYASSEAGPPPVLTPAVVAALVTSSSQNSLELAAAIRRGQVSLALEQIRDLLRQNEAPLRIVATLTRQFRTWLWVKLLTEAGERDPQVIARAAEVSNPKRVYFLQKEVQRLRSGQLQQALPLLLELELSLKQGNEPTATLQTRVIELCQVFKTGV